MSVPKMLDLKKIRKNFHKIPELAFEEFETQEYILTILKNFPELKIHTFNFTGILAEYTTLSNHSYKLFRADMDGLPILEQTNAEFSSQYKGIMHACGHDIHITVLLGLIEKIVNNKIKDNFLFLFQPAEETGGGANRIINTGILKKFNISSAYALHVTGKLPVGTISSKPDTFFVGTEEVDIDIYGKSSHVAFPKNSINALEIAYEIYLNIKNKIKNIPSKDKILCEFGKMTAGSVRNAIAGYANLQGTIRAANDDDMQQIKDSISEICEKYKNPAKLNVTFKNPYKPVKNNPDLFSKLKSITKNLGYNFIVSDMEMTGEDFGYFSHIYPSILFWLGADSPYELHSDKFLPDEKSIFVGIQVMFNLAISQ